MPAGRLFLDSSRPAAEALARGRTLAARVTAERPVALYAAPLELAAVVLGAYQHAGHALRKDGLEALALPVLRRQTGGAAVWAGDGVIYLALGLHDAGALLTCPPGRILNRNVRGLLAGIRALNVPAHYFGRDFVSFATDPGIYVGWDQDSSGRVLLEAFVAVETPFVLPVQLSGYPMSIEPPLRGKVATTLRKAGATQSTGAILSALAGGYGRGFAVEYQELPPDADELTAIAAARGALAVDVGDEQGLRWSKPLEEAIGFISAGARLDGSGRFAALAVGGDFYQHRACPQQLATALTGAAPDARTIGAALDAVYGAHPGRLEGIRSLGTMRDALLDAVERARS